MKFSAGSDSASAFKSTDLRSGLASGLRSSCVSGTRSIFWDETLLLDEGKYFLLELWVWLPDPREPARDETEVEDDGGRWTMPDCDIWDTWELTE
jgi:hypothetical protein